VAGAISRTATSPLERLKILRQVATVEYRGLSSMQAFKFMYTNEGWRGFFKGNGVNIVKIAPFSAFEFFFYELFKHTLFPNAAGNDPWSKLLCGGLTGCISQTLVRMIIYS
jgi:solute carrier family 25 (mitochondrial phosphate transporter), member 23/24/25/41